MNTRRIPFQFSTTDPVARQRELEKRFGLQSTCPKMYVDVNNPLSMGATPKEISSPRLQHRVPIFTEGYDHPIHSSSVDSMSSVPENKKPNVRVIPIEVEGDVRSPRHRNYSGPANTIKDRCCENPVLGRTEIPPFKRLNVDDVSKHAKPKLNPEPRVFNIPIQVEAADSTPKSAKHCENKSIPTPKPASTTPTSNGCAQSKLPRKAKSPSKTEVKVESTEKKAQKPENPVETLLKKIEDILSEFKSYETGVVEFTGTSKDKQYRYLDEMLTRCMLKLDDIDTMGNEEIRLARKSAVKKIQASIDLLESKANVQPTTTTETSVKQLAVDENTEMQVEVQDKTVEDNSVASTEIVSDNKESKVSESSENDETKTGSEVEPIKVEEKTNATDVEMCEIAVNDSTVETTNVDANFESNSPTLSVDVQVDENSSLQQQSNVPEVEMLEANSPNEVNSTNSAQSSDDMCVKQDADINEVATSDVEMADEKDLTTNSVEKSQVSEVEMGDMGIESPQECCDKKGSDCETVNDKSESDSVKGKTVSSVMRETAELCKLESETI